MMYVLVFHGNSSIGYFTEASEHLANIEILAQATRGFFILKPVTEFSHATSILSDDGTYIIPFDAATSIIVVSEDRLTSLPLDLGF